MFWSLNVVKIFKGFFFFLALNSQGSPILKYGNTFGGFLCLFGRWFIQTSDSSEIFGDADVDDKDTDDGDVEDVDVDPPEEFNVTTGDDETPETDEFWIGVHVWFI